MKSCFLLMLVLVLSCKPVSAEVLTEATFDSAVSEHPYFVKFFAPWCNYCKRMAPAWESFESSVTGTGIKIGEVDCTTDTALCSKVGVDGYPTLRLFDGSGSAAGVKAGAGADNGEGILYKGARTFDAMQDFVVEQTDKLNVKSAELKNPAFSAGLHILTDDSFLSTVAEGYTFVKFYAPWCGHCKAMAPVWAELATKFATSSAVKIAKIDCTVNKHTCNDVGVRGYPTLLMFGNSEQLSKYQGGRTIDAMTMFIKEQKGEIAVDSEPVDKTAITVEKGVSELTDSNFEKAVSTGVTFVKFYAPWCGHCKRLAPVWEELAHKFSTNVDVRIAKMDCTDSNKVCTKQGVRGYPTLILYTDGVKSSKHSGSRALSDLYEYVEFAVGELSESTDHDEL